MQALAMSRIWMIMAVRMSWRTRWSWWLNFETCFEVSAFGKLDTITRKAIELTLSAAISSPILTIIVFWEGIWWRRKRVDKSIMNLGAYDFSSTNHRVITEFVDQSYDLLTSNRGNKSSYSWKIPRRVYKDLRLISKDTELGSRDGRGKHNGWRATWFKISNQSLEYQTFLLEHFWFIQGKHGMCTT